jgi:hypothetical protein
MQNKMIHTIEQLVDKNKVVLDVLLRDLSKVRLHNIDDLKHELENHGGVDILLGDGGHPDIGSLQSEIGTVLSSGKGFVSKKGASQAESIDESQ